jgi:hypothetical protein
MKVCSIYPESFFLTTLLPNCLVNSMSVELSGFDELDKSSNHVLDLGIEKL